MDKGTEWTRIGWAMWLAHTVIVLDKSSEATIHRELPRVRVLRVANCVDLGKLPTPRQTPDGGRTVVFIGWVIPAKGINELVLAWSEMRPAGWRLVIAGPGDPEYQRALIRQYRPENMEFAGQL